MIDAFSEGVRSLGQVCHLVIVLPVALLIVAARGTWQSVAGAVAGVVLGGWLFVTGWWPLSDLAIRISALVVICVAIALGLPPLLQRERFVPPVAVGPIVAVTSLVIAQWWRPCVGAELGSILTKAPDAPLVQLLPAIGFMLGVSLPLLVLGLAFAIWQPGTPRSERTAGLGAGLAAIIGLSIVAGQHGEIVSRLFQWSQ